MVATASLWSLGGHRRRPILRTATELAAVCLCIGLLALNIYGVIYPADLRNRFPQHLLSYSQALSEIDTAWHREGATPRFFADATRIYHAASAYEWPDGMAWVAWRDDWILALSGHLGPLIHFLRPGVSPALFRQFQSYHYERALGRGFGICSQNALGLADLLYRKFDSDIHVVGLDGHVVTQVNLPDGRQMILDPSTGVVFSFSLGYAQSHLGEVTQAYTKAGYAKLAKLYGHAGNFISSRPGTDYYGSGSPDRLNRVRLYEAASDVLMWLIPLVGLLIVALLRIRTHRRGAAAAGAPAVIPT